MESVNSNHQTCVIVGAGHAGVNCAFALRREGWEGNIALFDEGAEVPYHRPPLSKTFLTGDDGLENHFLKPLESYEKEKITLHLNTKIDSIDRVGKRVKLADGSFRAYDKLVLATGARPAIPPIPGIQNAHDLFALRTAGDARRIREAIRALQPRRAVIIGGGYIGLEVAASLRKLGVDITVLEMEERLLARVAGIEISQFFRVLHEKNGVDICTGKKVVAIDSRSTRTEILCGDHSRFKADLIVVGVGIQVSAELAAAAGLAIENGIRVNASARTTDDHIYAIGDCTYHHNPFYDRWIRLESVQNAADQAKVAAAAICGKPSVYNALPWFWSDQYEVKLQTVGLSFGSNKTVVRREVDKPESFSVWYFKGDTLLAVDAVNNARAYVLGGKFIRKGLKIDLSRLADPLVELRPANITGKASQ